MNKVDRDRESRKVRRAKNPDKYRDADLRRVYNITLRQYNFLLEQQDFKCAICKKHKSEFKDNLCVDHCHMTNKIRGLLCKKCNAGLGQYNDMIIYFEFAKQYLLRSIVNEQDIRRY